MRNIFEQIKLISENNHLFFYYLITLHAIIAVVFLHYFVKAIAWLVNNTAASSESDDVHHVVYKSSASSGQQINETENDEDADDYDHQQESQMFKIIYDGIVKQFQTPGTPWKEKIDLLDTIIGFYVNNDDYEYLDEPDITDDMKKVIIEMFESLEDQLTILFNDSSTDLNDKITIYEWLGETYPNASHFE